MKTYRFCTETTHAAETRAWGARLAQLLRAGDVLALIGDLGAGKTAFTQGIAQGLGISVAVTSPTFVLVNRYRSPDGRTLQHADCYRLSHASAEMWDIGLTDLLAGDDIVVIEWADRITDLLPAERLEATFVYQDEARRQICFVGRGRRWVTVLRELHASQVSEH